jgi:small GTP-binding protein
VKLQIWDTAGQERFRTITSAYYKNAQGIMLVFDLRVRKTLENVEQFWLDEIKKYAEKDVQLVIVGNKADCEETEVKEDELATFSLKHGIPCFRVSAKTGDGVAGAYEALSRSCIKTFGKTSSESEKNNVADELRKKKAEFKLKTGQQEKQRKKCC